MLLGNFVLLWFTMFHHMLTVAIEHGLLKKFLPLIIGSVLRTTKLLYEINSSLLPDHFVPVNCFLVIDNYS